MKEIRKIGIPTRSEFEELWRADEPVVIQGVLEHWPAFKKWSLDYLKDQMGDRLIRVSETMTGEHRLHVSHPTKITGRRLIESYESDDPRERQRYHITQLRLLDTAPALLGDLSWPAFIRTGKIYQLCFWMAAQGTRTCLHWDGLPAMLALVMGEKEFWLFPPEEAENLYPNSLNDYPFINRSDVDCFNPDYEKHPRYRNAESYYVRIKAGDIAFVPPFWWHYVKNVKLSAAVRYEFDGHESKVSFFNDRRRLVQAGQTTADRPYLSRTLKV